MPDIYFIAVTSQATEVGDRIRNLVAEEDRYELQKDKWFVVYDGTVRDLAEKAGVRGGDERVGSGIVLPVMNYSGRASGALWDWLRKKGA